MQKLKISKINKIKSLVKNRSKNPSHIRGYNFLYMDLYVDSPYF